jgi:hypothetical protein
MADAFTGKSLPLDSDGLQDAIDALGVSAADFWAVLRVETSGAGFLPDRRPKILFERHVFSQRSKGRFDASHPDLSNPKPGGYGAGGAAQYARLQRAVALDETAALESASWGLGQVMGYNAERVGYRDVDEMVREMCQSEAAQVLAMARFIEAGKLAGALRTHDWARFASGYNGPNFRINSYDTRLAAAHQALERGALPDLDVRAGQMILSFLGFDPQGIDGVMGRMTRSAMNEFQEKNGLPQTDFFDAATLAGLRNAIV